MLFIQKNRFLSVVFALIAVIVVLIIVSYILNRPGEPEPIKFDYTRIQTRYPFTAYLDDEDLIIETLEPSYDDKETIRKTLGIPDYVDFEVRVPAAAQKKPIYNEEPGQASTTITPIPPDEVGDGD